MTIKKSNGGLRKGQRVVKTIYGPGANKESTRGVVDHVEDGVAFFRAEGSDSYDTGITFSAATGKELELLFLSVGMRSEIRKESKT